MTAAFARITELHDEQLWLTNPCARMIYRWLLRRCPAGKEQEFELKDFQDWSEFNRRRPRPYCLPWIWQGLNELVQIGLLSITKRYSRRCVKLVAYHPDAYQEKQNKTFKNKNKTFEKLSKSFKKETPKPYSIRHSYRENREQTDTNKKKTHPTHPVVVKKSECNQEEEDTSKIKKLGESAKTNEKTIKGNDYSNKENILNLSGVDNYSQEAQGILKEAKGTGIHLHPKLEQFILQSTLDVVKDAIAVVNEAKARGSLKNPAGLLIEAIKNQWKPSAVVEQDLSDNYLPVFLKWYEEAIASGLVEDMPVSYLSKDHHGDFLVRLRKPGAFGAPYTLVPWRELL
ncbi:hypothetical protein [Lyngbya aestuarii]|uniref:hypothetical protein n=1 Tax=Lyngbya aestuarii TaxID=118322 RepID=UPI00403DB00D